MVRFPSPDCWWSINRTPLVEGWVTESIDGRPVGPLMGDYPGHDVGTLRMRTMPNFWNHSSADHGVSTRLAPAGVDRTRIQVTWLVHQDAVEGKDYRLEALLPFWQLTSEQDWELCERNQAGVASSAFTPGPYSSKREYNVIRWSSGTSPRSGRSDPGRRDAVGPGRRGRMAWRGWPRAMDRGWAGGLASLLAAVLGSGGAAQAAPVPVELVSRGGLPSDTAGGLNPSMSADGRWVAFESWAGNLVPGQVTVAAGSINVFLHDRQTGATILVSRATGSVATAGNDSSFEPVVSADGTVVVYESFATNLVAGQVDTNQTTDVFLYDRVTGTTSLVSRTGTSPITTGDAFSSAVRRQRRRARRGLCRLGHRPGARPGRRPGTFDVFLYDRVGGTTTLVSRAAGSTTTTANGGSVTPQISADGNACCSRARPPTWWPARSTPTTLSDVFLFDTTTGATVLVSRAAASPVTAGTGSPSSRRSARTGPGWPSAAKPRPGGRNDRTGSRLDVFLFGWRAATTLVSRTAGRPPMSAGTTAPAPRGSAATAGLVAFVSSATNLVAGQADANGDLDVFLYDGGSGPRRW